MRIRIRLCILISYFCFKPQWQTFGKCSLIKAIETAWIDHLHEIMKIRTGLQIDRFIPEKDVKGWFLCYEGGIIFARNLCQRYIDLRILFLIIIDDLLICLPFLFILIRQQNGDGIRLDHRLVKTAFLLLGKYNEQCEDHQYIEEDQPVSPALMPIDPLLFRLHRLFFQKGAAKLSHALKTLSSFQ